MRILLIDLLPRSRLFRAPLWMPVYLTSTAAVLRAAGHEVSLAERGLLDEEERRVRPRVLRRFRKLVGEYKPDMLLFDVPAEVFTDLRDFGVEARSAAPRALILAGGRHPTLLPKDVLRSCAFLDGAITGDPEGPAAALAAGARLAGTPGTAGREPDRIVVRARREPTRDLDQLPFPAWDLLDMEYFTRRTPRVIPCLSLRTATIQTSRGCTGNCSYCSEGRMYDRPVRFHSAGYIRGMMQKLLDDYGVEGIYFSDEMFLADHGRVEVLCEELVRTGLSGRLQWTAQVRADSVSPRILRTMKKAGCVQLEFGIESGSQRILNGLSKGTTVEQNAGALRLTREAGIRSMAYVMYALPGESAEDVRATVDFLTQARPDIVRLIRYIPIPGTPLTNALIASGKMKPRFWADQVRTGDPHGGECVNLTDMTDGELLRASRSLYFRCAFPRYLRDTLRHHRLRDFPKLFDPALVPHSFLRKLFPSFHSR